MSTQAVLILWQLGGGPVAYCDIKAKGWSWNFVWAWVNNKDFNDDRQIIGHLTNLIDADNVCNPYFLWQSKLTRLGQMREVLLEIQTTNNKQ
jgi:hypothetical protein